MPAENSDRRVRKTRRLLRQALLELMQQKPVQQITVKEICARCDINRGTFYLHYKDVYELLASIEAEVLTQLETLLDTLTPAAFEKARTHPAMESLFEFLGQNADICRVLLCAGGDPAFLQQVHTVIRLRVLSSWGERLAKAGGNYEYTYAFIVSGCIGMLQHWLEEDQPLPPKAMAAMIETILGRGLAVLE